MKNFKEGLWDNIHKKRERIKGGSGERMRKKGEKGAPTTDQIKNAQKEEMTTTANIPNPATTKMGPTVAFLDRRSKKKVKYLKQFRDYYAEKGIR